MRNLIECLIFIWLCIIKMLTLIILIITAIAMLISSIFTRTKIKPIQLDSILEEFNNQ